MGIRDKPIAPGSPWQNGFAERLIGSIRRECVDHVVVLGEAHLRRILTKYAAYYNEVRTHRSLNKDAPIHRAIQQVGGHRICPRPWQPSSPLLPNLVFSTHKGSDIGNYWDLRSSLNSASSHSCIENRSDASKIRAAAQSGSATVPAWQGSFALLCILVSASSALAQRPDDFRRTFVMVAQSAPVQAAQAQLERQDRDPVGVQSSAYAVSGLVLGAPVQFDSAAFKDYKCTPSDQFDGFTWCQKTRQEKERRGKFISTYSILHSRGGVAVYIDRHLEPAFFGPREADDDIRQYSRNIGETPRITRMPQRDGFPNGILASWGKVELEPLDNDSIKALAEGRRATTNGYIVDFIGDFARSATNGLPLYRISGGAGFVWVASFDQRGRGTLRLTAVDASALTAPRTPIDAAENAAAQNVIGTTTNQLPHADEKESDEQANSDAERAPEDAEKARDDALSAKTELEKAAVEERAKVNPVFSQL